MKVTVITVCLNAEKTIAKTIQSVLDQDHGNIEYVIVDGGSADGTADIAEEYLQLFDARMRFVSESDNGIYYAMNKGIAMATGEVIAILNADDWYEAGAVRAAVEVLGEPANNVDMVYGVVRLVSQEEEPIRLIGPYPEEFTESSHTNHPSWFVKRTVHDELGVYDTRYAYAADYEMLHRICCAGKTVVRLDQVMASHRLGGVSTRPENRSRILNEVNSIVYRYGWISARRYWFNRIRLLIS